MMLIRSSIIGFILWGDVGVIFIEVRFEGTPRGGFSICIPLIHKTKSVIFCVLSMLLPLAIFVTIQDPRTCTWFPIQHPAEFRSGLLLRNHIL